MHRTTSGTVSAQTFFGGTTIHQIRSMWQDVYRIKAMLSTGFLKFNCSCCIKGWSRPGALGAQEKGKSMTSHGHTWFDCFPYSSLRILINWYKNKIDIRSAQTPYLEKAFLLTWYWDMSTYVFFLWLYLPFPWHFFFSATAIWWFCIRMS